MTELESIAQLLGPAAQCTSSYGMTVVDVAPGDWLASVSALRDAGWSLFDFLTAVDRAEQGIEVVVLLWSVDRRQRVEVRTRCPGEMPSVPSLTGVFGGAAWHERQVWEMFGVEFPGHPGLTPLLLPTGFQGRPLRKEFVLTARDGKPWPGLKGPGGAQ